MQSIFFQAAIVLASVGLVHAFAQAPARPASPSAAEVDIMPAVFEASRQGDASTAWRDAVKRLAGYTAPGADRD
jgi:hypothetical protein